MAVDVVPATVIASLDTEEPAEVVGDSRIPTSAVQDNREAGLGRLATVGLGAHRLAVL
jgi:hypothetical protein